MTFTVGVDLGFVLGCFLLIFYHIASRTRKAKIKNTKPNSQKALGSLTSTVMDVGAHSVIVLSFLIDGSNKGKTKSKTPNSSLKKPLAF